MSPQAAQVVNIQPWGDSLREHHTQSLGHFEHVELLRLVVRAGTKLPPHRAACLVTLQCLEGETLLHRDDAEPVRLKAGQLICLAKGESHTIEGVSDASLLLTIVGEPKPSVPERPVLDEVDEASVESFPASDPPAQTPIIRNGP